MEDYIQENEQNIENRIEEFKAKKFPTGEELESLIAAINDLVTLLIIDGKDEKADEYIKKERLLRNNKLEQEVLFLKKTGAIEYISKN